MKLTVKAINEVNSLVIVENILIMLIDKNIVANCRIYKEEDTEFYPSLQKSLF